MKKFLATFIGTAAASDKAKWKENAEQHRALEEAGMAAWGKWVMENEKSIVDHGSPVGKTKRVAPDGISDIRNQIAAYVIVQAESHAAAAKLFEAHPHFSIFPGDSVEVMECLPLPER
jgi:hypothetical protein